MKMKRQDTRKFTLEFFNFVQSQKDKTFTHKTLRRYLHNNYPVFCASYSDKQIRKWAANRVYRWSYKGMIDRVKTGVYKVRAIYLRRTQIGKYENWRPYNETKELKLSKTIEYLKNLDKDTRQDVIDELKKIVEKDEVTYIKLVYQKSGDTKELSLTWE